MHGESFSYPCSTPLSDVPILPLYYTFFLYAGHVITLDAPYSAGY